MERRGEVRTRASSSCGLHSLYSGLLSDEYLGTVDSKMILSNVQEMDVEI